MTTEKIIPKKKFGGKGSRPRPTVISTEEGDLRWELISSKTSPERKEEIKNLLEGFKSGRDNYLTRE